MSKKLLLADDSITIQKVIQITFAHEDYELTVTDNGDAALAQAQALQPDLVMADVYMPGKNGYELCSAVKQDPALQHVPVLLLAGSFEPFDEDKARAAKADAWIEKPFESQTLVDKVAELLSAATASAGVAAPVMEEPTAAPVAEPQPTPVQQVDEVFIEEPVAAEEPLGVAPAEDVFADAGLDTSPAEAIEEPAAISDDWSDVTVEPEAPAAAAEPSIDDFGFEAEVPAAEVPAEDDFTFTAEPVAAPVADVSAEDDFTFAEEPVSAPAEDDFTFAEEPVAAVAAAEPDLSAFADADEDVMSLDEDDILGAEELEPIPEEPTLAAWSRDDAFEDEPLAEPIAEESLEAVAAVAVEAPAAEPVAEPFAEEDVEAIPDPAVETAAFEPAFEADVEPIAVESVEDMEIIPEASVPVEEPAAAPAVAEASMDVEAKVGALSEAELEQIVEKVVSQVVEKLAGTILERVAWEVVPDMAENIIKTEIRKIKENAA